MKDVYEVLLQLRATKSLKDKLAILQANQGNYHLRLFLRTALEPSINFYQKKLETDRYLPMVEGQAPARQFNDHTINDLLKVIAGRELTGDAARDYTSKLYHGLSTDWEREMLVALIERDIKSGTGIGTINKVWPGLITDVPYQRCSLPKHAKLSDWPWAEGIISQEKADGMFCNADHRSGGKVSLTSRNGTPFPMDQFKELADVIAAKLRVETQTHGELLIEKGGQAGSALPKRILPREQGNGIFNSILSGGKFEADERPVFVVWDQIPLAAATAKGKYPTGYKARFHELMLQMLFVGSSSLQIIPSKTVYSLTEAYAHYKELLLAKKEGSIISNPNGGWVDGDSKDKVKLKLEVPVDLKIIGFKAGDGKNASTFGSVVCSTSDDLLEVGVSGFTDALRAAIWANRQTVLGKIMTVLSNGIMKPSKEGEKHSLFLPRHVEIREDKTTADSLQDVFDQFESAVNNV